MHQNTDSNLRDLDSTKVSFTQSESKSSQVQKQIISGSQWINIEGASEWVQDQQPQSFFSFAGFFCLVSHQLIIQNRLQVPRTTKLNIPQPPSKPSSSII